MRASRTGSDRGYLNEIRIEPSSRGKGLGMAMVAAALHYLRQAGVDRVDLDTPGENTAAHSLALRPVLPVPAIGCTFSSNSSVKREETEPQRHEGDTKYTKDFRSGTQ